MLSKIMVSLRAQRSNLAQMEAPQIETRPIEIASSLSAPRNDTAHTVSLASAAKRSSFPGRNPG